MKRLEMNLGERSYGITVGKGALDMASELLGLDRKVFILTDAGVPKEYAEKIKSQAREAKIFTVGEGEGSKSFDALESVLSAMLDFDMSRGDALVSVGGGVVGDLGGFAASIYMRGIDFYNVPTTLLSQVDSSIGGKTAINLNGVKNTVGAFYQPKAVLIDTDTLKSLPKRQILSGLAESIKMALTSDEELFALLTAEGLTEKNTETVILRSLMIKKSVVECDERESGLRKILNFGHTLGHGIESAEEMSGLYHGECVALGMIPMCSPELREKVKGLLSRVGLPTKYEGNIDAALDFITHDKKCRGGMVEAIFVDTPGSYRIEKLSLDDFSKIIKEAVTE